MDPIDKSSERKESISGIYKGNVTGWDALPKLMNHRLFSNHTVEPIGISTVMAKGLADTTKLPSYGSNPQERQIV